MEDVDEFGVMCLMDCWWAHPRRCFLWSAFPALWKHARMACTQAAMRTVDQPSSSLCFLTKSTGFSATCSFTFCLSFSDWHGLSRFGLCTFWDKSAQIAYWFNLGDCCSTNPDHSWERHWGSCPWRILTEEGVEWPSTIWYKGMRE